MSHASRTPYLIASCAESIPDVENDCACTNAYVGSSLPDLKFSTSAFDSLPSSLYYDKIDESHYVVLNLEEGNRPVVLNKDAFELLDSFANPHCILSLQEHQFTDYFREYHLISQTHLRQSRVDSEPKTLVAWLHLTNACNLRCSYCFVQQTNEVLNITQGKLALDAIFNSATKHGFSAVKIKYAGGEPTLKMDILSSLHEYAQILADERDLDLSGVVLSNGVSLKTHHIPVLKQQNLRIMISLDGIGAMHDGQRPLVDRRRGSFQYVEKTLAILQDVGIIPTISITITSHNLPGLPEVVEYLLHRKLPFSLNFFRDNIFTGVDAFKYDSQALIQALQEVFAILEKNLPSWNLLDSVLDRVRFSHPHSKPCGVEDNYLVVDQRGNFAKCHMEITNTITNVDCEDPLGEIQKHPSKWRNLSVDEKQQCQSCQWRLWCAGGCPALTYQRFGRSDVKSPNCAVYQALFSGVLRLEGLRLLKYGNKRC